MGTAVLTGKAAAPDLTAPGVIDATDKTLTYNLGPTGMRGWLYNQEGSGSDGTISWLSRQILVTTVGTNTPASGTLAANDVLLGVSTGSGTPVPLFSSDARKSLGWAITAAEAGDGVMNLKRWRAGVTTDVSIQLQVLGAYSATAPYNCPKSALILSNACAIIANRSFGVGSPGDPVLGLALLAGGYTNVLPKAQAYALSIAPSDLALRIAPGQSAQGVDVWNNGYRGIFLSEYYLLTGDTNVLHGLEEYIVALAQAQSRYGTMCHGGSLLNADGSLHGTQLPYGPVNQGALSASLAIALGKKCMVASGRALDPEINPALYRAAKFFGFFADKGAIPYGEHEPWYEHDGANGKDGLAALMFAMMGGWSAETEYFARLATAGYNGREYGHTGQGFSYLWSSLGANVGGTNALASHLAQVQWHLDLSRRCDGSFVYDGTEQYGGSAVSDYWAVGGNNSYNGIDPTASYVLTYAASSRKLYITGKNANLTNALSDATATNAIWAGQFKLARSGYTTNQLFAALGEYDPLVRDWAATELAARPGLNVAAFITMAGSSDARLRQSACQVLGILKDTSALTVLGTRLSDPDVWVRAKAARALQNFGSTATPQLTTMLTAFAANATDSYVIDWVDPVQQANGFLSSGLFGGGFIGTPNLAAYTIGASTNLLYPAIKAGLKQPDYLPRSGVVQFCFENLGTADVQALALDILEVITTKCQADTMWHSSPQIIGLLLLVKHKCAEGLPLALSLMDVQPGWDHGSAAYLAQVLENLVFYGDSARWAMPFLNEDISTLYHVLNIVDYEPTVPRIQSAIATIDNATTSPGGIIHLLPLATPQVVVTTNAKAITLAGTSPRSAVTFTNVTMPAHGMLTGTAPDLTYTPNGGYTGLDHFTFQVVDNLTTSAPGTVCILVGTPGTGLKAEYYDNADFTDLKLTRNDATINFDWGAGAPTNTMASDTFSVRWSGVVLVPETGSYTFSTLNSDGVRLYINGVPVINQFADQELNWNDSTPLALTEGQWVDIQMDYYENTNAAVAKLKWTGPSFAGLNGEIIGSQWLFDGTGMNRASYAFPQSLTLLKNVSQPLTLTGSADTLTYSVVTPPSHGTLSNKAPNLVYTPFADYIGLDSFTFTVNNGTTDSVPATVSLDVIPADTFSVNFYVGPEWPYGGLTTDEQMANLFVYPDMYAGLTDWFTHSWQNFLVPWLPSGPLAPVTLTSNKGSPATFTFKYCRNGYTYDGPRTTLLGEGNGNMMDGHVNSTLDGPYLFDMEVTSIPFAVYDVIFYMGANKDQYGDGTGVIKFNGGADRAFTLKPGAFDGSFSEMMDATTPGNYVIFRYVTGSSFTAQTWGTGLGGFNHIGPCGFQIREVIVLPQTITFGALAPKTYGDAPFALTATASSGLTVSYASSDTNVATVAGSTVTILKAGTTVITASQAGSGDYYAATNVLQTLTVNKLPVALAGTRTYDATTTAAVADLSLANKVGTDDLTLSGSALLAGKGAGDQTVTNVITFATPARIRSATGSTGSSAANTFAVTLGAAPANGNTLVAVIATRGASSNRVTSITQTGVTNWVRAAQAANIDGSTTELWYAPNVSGAGTGITINQASLISAAVVMEYCGILAVSPVDQIAGAIGTGTVGAVTGTTPTTTQANELWIGGIGIEDGRKTLNAPYSNAFTVVASSKSGTANSDAMVYALEKSVSATGAASSGGALSSLDTWSGAIATFKAASTSILTLGGADAANYTLTGMSGTMNVQPKALTLANTTATNTIYDATVTATLTNGTLLTAEAPGAGTTADGKPYTGDAVGVTLSGLFDTKDVAAAKDVTSTSSLTGAQAGNYTLTQPTGLTADITPKALTVEGAAIASKAYDGTTNATFSAGGLKTAEAPGTGTTSDNAPYIGDAVGVSLSGFFASKNVGSGITVTSTSSLTDAQAANYMLTQPADLTGAITNVPLTVTASDQSKNFGQDLTFGSGSTLFTSSGLVAGEAIGTVTLTCTGGAAGAAVGTYSIMPSASTGGIFTPANYAITYLPGTLTVTATSQIITFGPLAAKTYGDAPFSLAATASSLLAVSYESSDPAVASVSGSMLTIHTGGSTTITATQAGNANYAAATPVQQVLTVNAASQTITFDALAAKTYGDAPFSLTATASSGLEVSYSSSDTNVATVAGNLVTILNVGATTITATQAGNTNYSAAMSVPQALTVNKRIVFLAEDFEHEWLDNTLARSTNNWTSSGLFDQSSITNPAVGYAALPHNVIFPLTYDHTASRRVLKIDTQGASLHTPVLAAGFASSRIYVDMMLKFSISEILPSEPLNGDSQKTAVLLLDNGVTTNLLILHGQKTADGFGDPVFTTMPGNFAAENWYRLTLTFDATANNGRAEAFSVRVNGGLLVSTNAYSDTWKTRIFSGTYTPDSGSWFLSTARRLGSAGTNQTWVTGISFDGICWVDDLVVTATQPAFVPGTVIFLALSTGSGSEAWMGM